VGQDDVPEPVALVTGRFLLAAACFDDSRRETMIAEFSSPLDDVSRQARREHTASRASWQTYFAC
jgi:hypothetical protein